MTDRENIEKLGERIKEVREQKGISQEALARSIGEDVFYIQQLESGLIDLGMGELGALITELDIPVSKFFESFK